MVADPANEGLVEGHRHISLQDWISVQHDVPRVGLGNERDLLGETRRFQIDP